MKIIDENVTLFTKIFGGKPSAAGVAPGRVEILGNHTDYNDGYILAAAIDRYIVVCGRPLAEPIAKIHAAAFSQTAQFSTRTPEKNPRHSWADYVAGCVDRLSALGIAIGGFEATIHGDVPLGAGVSSSAALEVATIYFLQAIYGFSLSKIEIAKTAQAAENYFVGMNCGILDQFSSAIGAAGQLIFLDCRQLENYAHLPLRPTDALVLANTNIKHSLVDGQYNALRSDCFAAAKFFAEKIPSRKITHLREVEIADYQEFASALPDPLNRRAWHIITENARVLTAAQALKNDDRNAFGDCMNQSHCSSRDNFGNSCAELDAMFDCAENLPGLCGRRLSGGGFGGCTVNLVDRKNAEEFGATLAERYRAKTEITPTIHIFNPADGAYNCQI